MFHRPNPLRYVLAAALIVSATNAAAQPTPAGETLLLRQPAISRDHLAFVHAGDIWLADRNGKNPQRLTAHPADEFAPSFSPDGKWIAFSARYDGNTDVYVMPVTGGQPKRLTWHPGLDTVNGWSRDGKRVLFASPREIALGRSNQLYEVSVDGGFEKKVMEAQAFEGAWSPDSKRLAYRPYRMSHSGGAGWRQNRGGSTPPIWIIDQATNSWEKIPHVNASDSNPLWIGNDIVFISDRNDGAANLFLYNGQTKALRQLTKETVWDVRSATAYGNTVVFETGGRLKEIDVASGAIRELPISLALQSIQARSQWKDAATAMTSARLSSTGKRVVVSARGDVFTVPVKDGSVRNITQTAGVREKDALWSPDGKQVAYVSDAGMKHALVIRDQAGLDKPRSYDLGKSYYNLLAWTPDGKTIVYQDNHLNLYSIATGTGVSKLIDNRLRRGGFSVSISHDSRWLAYTISGENYMNRIRIHEFATGKNTTVTDGLAHADNPVFAGSDYLYFTASINAGPSQVGLDMSSQERPVRDGIYALVLAADGKSPMAPRTGDEEDKKDEKKDEKKDGDKDSKPADKEGEKAPPKEEPKPTIKPDAAKTAEPAKSGAGASGAAATANKPPKPVRIDFDGLAQRVVALPVAERNYDSLAVASDGNLFYLERRQPGVTNEPPEAEASGNAELVRFNFEERKPKSIKTGVQNFSLSADGKKMLLQYNRGKLEIADANEKLDAKPIDMTQVGMTLDPRAEWLQIFNETWWMQKEFFYDANLHGLDWDAVRARYLPLLSHVQRREDLNELLREMIGELQVGHNNVGGGDLHRERPSAVGLLGADIVVENNHYRLKTIYAGDRWNPFLKAPLAVPGLGVKAGDYLLAVNGRPVTAADNLYAFLENTVGKQVTLSVGADASGKGAKNIVVQPIANEAGLRQWHWIEKNRQYVDKATGGKIAYVYLPDTGGDGYKHFNRMFFAQVDKEGVIVDDRRNSGGQAANYVTDVLSRTYLSGWKDRDGLTFETPGGAIYGPKAMLIDQDAGSGGDFLPYSFKRMKLGPLIGKRTWGGLIGISANPPLIDGGNLTVPFFRFFTPEKEWRVENEGVAPDIDVELDPLEVNRGRDTQLDAAIKSVMDRMQGDKNKTRLTPPVPAKLGQ
jgi:tricorn protease